jgi:hypothetical protein
MAVIDAQGMAGMIDFINAMSGERGIGRGSRYRLGGEEDDGDRIG